MVSLNQSKEDLRDKLIVELWEDIANKSDLLKPLYKEMQDSPTIRSLPAGNQFIILFSQAKFAKSDEERVYVAGIFYSRIFDRDIIPKVSKHHGLNLASKCLVSLSLFEDYIGCKYNRRTAPSPKFYRAVGKSEFEKAGKYDVSTNFDEWTSYAKEVLFF